ncbi:MAG TPA: transposase [Bryobacteraceae bacterium]|nr:transposase [Bryobacteraceae bacterium]
MTIAAYELNEGDRAVVIASIRETCAYHGWGLLAAHVRTEHVHVVVYAEVNPESVVRDLKTYASRRLNERGPRVEKRWTRRASTRWLKTRESVLAAIRYVAEEQGNPMALHVSDDLAV